MPAPRPLGDFYLGTAPDDHGRTFDAILAHDDEWLDTPTISSSGCSR